VLLVSQVESRLNLKKTAVYALIEKGLLPAVRVGPNGGGVRVLEEDLEAFIESRRTQPPARKVAPSNLKRTRAGN
jgi:excisionase family DNA binding protein